MVDHVCCYIQCYYLNVRFTHLTRCLVREYDRIATASFLLSKDYHHMIFQAIFSALKFLFYSCSSVIVKSSILIQNATQVSIKSHWFYFFISFYPSLIFVSSYYLFLMHWHIPVIRMFYSQPYFSLSFKLGDDQSKYSNWFALDSQSPVD